MFSSMSKQRSCAISASRSGPSCVRVGGSSSADRPKQPSTRLGARWRASRTNITTAISSISIACSRRSGASRRAPTFRGSRCRAHSSSRATSSVVGVAEDLAPRTRTVLDVEHESLQQQLEAEDQWDHAHDDGARGRGDALLRMTPPLICAEDHTPDEEGQPGEQEQRDRREVAEHVFRVDAVDRAADQQEREWQKDPPDAEVRAFIAVACGDRDVPHGDVEDVQTDEHVVLEEVAVADACRIEELPDDAPDREIAVLRIDDVPVARRELGEEREGEVADDTQPRHAGQRLLVDEAVALRVSGARVIDERVEELRELGEIHLVVAVDLHEQVRSGLGAAGEPGAHRSADTAVAVVTYDLDALVGRRLEPLERVVAAAVVDRDDLIDVVGDGGKNGGDVRRDVVAGDHDADALSSVQRAPPMASPRSTGRILPQ